MRLKAATAVTAALLVGLTGAAGPAMAGAEKLTWKWSDEAAGNRVFLHTEWEAENLPSIEAQAEPGKMVYLKFYQGGEWNTEYLTRVGKSGKATLYFDPMCEDGTWCTGEYLYRVSSGGVGHTFTVKLSEH